jgi:hypothetical protein
MRASSSSSEDSRWSVVAQHRSRVPGPGPAPAPCPRGSPPRRIRRPSRSSAPRSRSSRLPRVSQGCPPRPWAMRSLRRSRSNPMRMRASPRLPCERRFWSSWPSEGIGAHGARARALRGHSSGQRSPCASVRARTRPRATVMPAISVSILFFEECKLLEIGILATCAVNRVRSLRRLARAHRAGDAGATRLAGRKPARVGYNSCVTSRSEVAKRTESCALRVRRQPTEAACVPRASAEWSPT